MRYLFTILLFISTALIAIAQPVAPCPDGQKYDAGQDTCTVPFSQNAGPYLIFAGLFVLIIVAIFAGRPILKKLGVKSNKTSDSEGGIH
jgi:hypothetical protein